MKILFIAIAALLLAGCASFDVMAPKVADKGARVSDNALTAAEWAICNAASVGSVRRRYGATVEMADAWNELCSMDKGKIVQGPAE